MRRVRRQAKGVCEHCGHPVRAGSLEVHHIFTKGAGVVEIPANLIALCGPFDQDCHGRAQRYVIPRWRLLLITARREKTTPEAIQAEVWRIRQLDHLTPMEEVG